MKWEIDVAADAKAEARKLAKSMARNLRSFQGAGCATPVRWT